MNSILSIEPSREELLTALRIQGYRAPAKILRTLGEEELAKLKEFALEQRPQVKGQQ